MILIESLDNKIIKYIKALDTKKGREKYNKFIIEGEKYISSIPKVWDIECYIFSESMSYKIDLRKYSSRAQVYIIKDNTFKTITDTVTPQGALAICTKLEYKLENILISEKPLFLLLLEELNDPGNLGTIIRTAESAGVCGVIISSSSVDIYNKKVLRATAGAIFYIPIIQGIDIISCCQLLKTRGIKLFSTHLKGEQYPYNLNFNEDCAIIIGNEARGLSDNILKVTDNIVKIPMIGSSDSLNASVAGGILLYEVVRQRLK